jgi:hypothetical protein
MLLIPLNDWGYFVRHFFPIILAAAALLSPSAYAATWNISFTFSNGASAGNGTLDFPSLSPDAVALATSWSFMLDGQSFTGTGPTGPAYSGTPQLQQFFGFPIVQFAQFAADGLSRYTATAFGSQISVDPDVFLVEGYWEVAGCLEAFGSGLDNCRTPIIRDDLRVRGSYTLVKVTDDPEPPVIPLPATAALLPLGLGALAVIRRRKTKG